MIDIAKLRALYLTSDSAVKDMPELLDELELARTFVSAFKMAHAEGSTMKDFQVMGKALAAYDAHVKR